jgi:hypothetical protein
MTAEKVKEDGGFWWKPRMEGKSSVAGGEKCERSSRMHRETD